MICKECGSPMRLDDRDRINNGGYDNYWECDNCNTSCTEVVRCGISLVEHWHKETSTEIVNTTVTKEFCSG